MSRGEQLRVAFKRWWCSSERPSINDPEELAEHAFYNGAALKPEPGTCEHKNEQHHADNGPSSGGCLYWCPDCGALSSTVDRTIRDWKKPGVRK